MTPKFELYKDTVIFTSASGGAILYVNELWYPFRYMDNGTIDILSNEGYIKPSTAYKMVKLLDS